MPLGERLLRALEGHLLPWYNRAEDEARLAASTQALVDEDVKARHTEQIRRDSIAARIASEKVRADYRLMAARLRR